MEKVGVLDKVGDIEKIIRKSPFLSKLLSETLIFSRVYSIPLHTHSSRDDRRLSDLLDWIL